MISVRVKVRVRVSVRVRVRVRIRVRVRVRVSVRVRVRVRPIAVHFDGPAKVTFRVRDRVRVWFRVRGEPPCYLVAARRSTQCPCSVVISPHCTSASPSALVISPAAAYHPSHAKRLLFIHPPQPSLHPPTPPRVAKVTFYP